MKRAYLWLCLLLPVCTWAAPDGRVRLSVDVDETYWVGQRVPVHLDIMSNGFSFSSQRFNLPQIEGGVLLQTDSSTIKLSERIDGESWQVLRYDLSLFSQREGAVQIPSFDVHFAASQGYGQPTTSFDLKTEALSLVLKMPPGADVSQAVVTSPQLTVKEQWQPADQDSFTVGDALSRTIIIDAEDVSAIALPAAPQQEIPGIDLLAKPPLVQDKSDRGDLLGHREEQVSYLFKRAGSYTLPGGTISWWNPERKKLEQYEFAAKSIEVAADPLAKTTADGSAKENQQNSIILVLLAVLLLLVSAIAYWRWPHWRARRRARFDAEPARFKRALKACRKNDVRTAWSMTNVWLASTGLSIPAEHEAIWQDLQRAMVSKSDDWSGHALKNSLISLRESKRSQDNKVVYLKPLNP